jgi:ATP-dependent Zn protease
LVNASYPTISPGGLAPGSIAYLTPAYNTVSAGDIKSAVIRASGIQVAWQSTDSEIVKLVGTSAGSLGATGSANSGSSKLSTTGIILISVLVPVFVLCMLIGGVFFFLRARKRRHIEGIAEIEAAKDASKEEAGEKGSVRSEDGHGSNLEAPLEKIELSISQTESEEQEDVSEPPPVPDKF